MSDRVPALPSTSGIADPHVRGALDALFNAWRLRSGDVGSGTDKFLTRADLQSLVKDDSNLRNAVASAVADELFGEQPATGGVNSGVAGGLKERIDSVLGQLQNDILSSQLVQDLGTRIERLDGPNYLPGSVANLQDAVVQRFNDSLIATANTREELLTQNEARIKDINGIGVRVGNNEADIVKIKEVTSNINSVTLSIIDSAIAKYNSGQAVAGFASFGSAITNATAATLKQVDDKFTSFGNNIGSLQVATNAGTTSISSAVSQTLTLFNQVNNTTNGLQVRLSSAITDIGDLESQFTVKIDQNGAVSGFGLASTTRNAVPTSAFIVRADKFAIVSPNYAGGFDTTPEPATAPFVVTTTNTTLPDGKTLPPGVYLNKAVAKEIYSGYIEGSYIKATTLEAADVFTGSRYIDRVNRLQVPAVAITGTTGTINAVGDARTHFTNGWVLYGPNFYPSVPYKQRIRDTNSGVLLPTTITVSAITDSRLSLYMAYNGTTNYIPLAVTEDAQVDYGAAALTWSGEISCARTEYVTFYVRSTDFDGSIFNPAKPSLFRLNISVSVVNL